MKTSKTKKAARAAKAAKPITTQKAGEGAKAPTPANSFTAAATTITGEEATSAYKAGDTTALVDVASEAAPDYTQPNPELPADIAPEDMQVNNPPPLASQPADANYNAVAGAGEPGGYAPGDKEYDESNAGPGATPEIETADAGDDEDFLDRMSVYVDHYPQEKVFYITSDDQVFLSDGKQDADAHQKSIEPGVPVKAYEII